VIRYVCKYTPIELFAGFGAGCAVLDEIPENFDLSDGVAHANLCGFGKSVIEAVLAGEVDELVLVNCCDTMRRVYDVVRKSEACRFLHLIDLPHDGGCGREGLARELLRLKAACAAYTRREFDRKAFAAAFSPPSPAVEPYVGILGVRAGREMEAMIRDGLALPVRNLTCIGNRAVAAPGSSPGNGADETALFMEYAGALLSQLPCRRMNDTTGRKQLYNDPSLRGIVYHTIKFCDYYGFEYAEIKNGLSVPILRLETDYTLQSRGQLRTRIEAFSETLSGLGGRERIKMNETGKYYVAGIDSGSASTDVVILDNDRNIVASIVIPTGGGAQSSAERSLEEALHLAGMERGAVSRIVATGYGREHIRNGGESITEISCHARGAHFLNPGVRTVIDIGGQDSKVIRIDETGVVRNFVMNGKCAAGTGRFLEMMARTLGLSLKEMSEMGLSWKEDVVISSMCTVFAESEVVSLVAQNRAVPDIIHGLNNSVAAKVAALVGRLGLEGDFIITGGVAKNKGVVHAIEGKLGIKLYVCDEAQICGALGAALFALD